MQVTNMPDGYSNPYTQGAAGANKSTEAYISPANCESQEESPDVQIDISDEAKALFEQMEWEKEHWDELHRLERVDYVIDSDNLELDDSQGLFIDLEAAANQQPIKSFSSGTLEHYLTQVFNLVSDNGADIADELGKMIKSAYHGNGASIEERAMNREAGLKMAEYFADNYLSDPEAKKTFLDEINRYAELDVLREKGYICWEEDGIDYEPYKSYSMPNAPEGFVRGSLIAKKAGLSDMLEASQNLIQFAAYKATLMGSNRNLRNQIINDFNRNEKNVENIITQIKNSIDEEALAKGAKEFWDKYVGAEKGGRI